MDSRIHKKIEPVSRQDSAATGRNELMNVQNARQTETGSNATKERAASFGSMLSLALRIVRKVFSACGRGLGRIATPASVDLQTDFGIAPTTSQPRTPWNAPLRAARGVFGVPRAKLAEIPPNNLLSPGLIYTDCAACR